MRVKLLVIVLVCGLVEQLSAQTQVKIDSLLHVIIAVSTKDVSNEARELAKLLSTEDAKGLDARAPDVLNALTGVSSVPKITTLLLLGKIYEKIAWLPGPSGFIEKVINRLSSSETNILRLSLCEVCHLLITTRDCTPKP